MGRMSVRERAIGLIMLATLAIWIVGGEELGSRTVALGAAVMIFRAAARPLERRRAVRELGRALHVRRRDRARLAALHRSGASEWIASVTISRWASNPIEVIAIISAFGIVLTEAMSHSGRRRARSCPVALGIATRYHIDPGSWRPRSRLAIGARVHAARRHAGQRDRAFVGLHAAPRHARAGRASRRDRLGGVQPRRPSTTAADRG